MAGATGGVFALLPAGVVRVEGSFGRDAAAEVVAPEGAPIAHGHPPRPAPRAAPHHDGIEDALRHLDASSVPESGRPPEPVLPAAALSPPEGLPTVKSPIFSCVM